MKIFAVAVFGMKNISGEYTHYIEVVCEADVASATSAVVARFREKLPAYRVVSTVNTEVDTTNL